ncbi:MAG: hypothetical protein ACE5FY_04825, partial [Nitrospiria bacterium]
PFYGIHKKGDGYRKRFILGPVYIKTEDGSAGLIQHDFLYPIFSRKQEGEKRRTWLIPLYYHQTDPDGRFSLGISPLILPFYHRYRKGSYREVGAFWPLIRFGEDSEQDLRFSQFFLFLNKRKGEEALTSVIPFWMHKTMPKRTTDASLFLHWYQQDRVKKKTNLSFLWLIPPDTPPIVSRFSLPGLSLIWYEYSSNLTRHGFFPLYSYEKNNVADGMKWTFLWPLFSYQSVGDLVKKTGFLWQVITYERKDAETSDFRFLWRLIRRSKRLEGTTFEFNPFFFYESQKGKGNYWAILGGLFGRETSRDGEAKTRWLWIF